MADKQDYTIICMVLPKALTVTCSHCKGTSSITEVEIVILKKNNEVTKSDILNSHAPIICKHCYKVTGILFPQNTDNYPNTPSTPQSIPN